LLQRGAPGRLFMAIGPAAIAYLVILTWLGYAANPTR
jgi:hypothetical protein